MFMIHVILCEKRVEGMPRSPAWTGSNREPFSTAAATAAQTSFSAAQR